MKKLIVSIMAFTWMLVAIGAADDDINNIYVEDTEYDLTKRGLALFCQLPVELQAKISRYVLADDDIKCKLFDKPMVKHILRGHTDSVNTVAFNLDGTQIVSASLDNTVRTWDADTGQELHILRGHRGWIRSAAFNQDGKQIVSASDDKTLRIWDAHAGQLLRALHHNDPMVRSAAFNEAGDCVVSMSYDKTIRIRDVHTNQLLRILQYNGPVDPLSEAFNKARNQVVVAGNDNVNDHTLRIKDAHTGQEFHILRGHTNLINWAVFNKTGKQIVSASYDKTVRTWDADTGQELYILRGHEGGVQSAAFNKAGTLVVSAGDDRTVRIWESLPYERYHFNLEQALWIYCRYGIMNDRAERAKNEQSQLHLSESYLSLMHPFSKLTLGVRLIKEGIRAIVGAPELSQEKREQKIRKQAIKQSIREQYPEILDGLEHIE